MRNEMHRTNPSGQDRRDFLRTAFGGAVIAVPGYALFRFSGESEYSQQATPPWYRRTFRWGQTNINELDPTRYDIAWWREHWKRTRTQGLVINAGGIVAYFPSRNPLQYRAQFLNGRDLYGELVRAAHEQDIAVLARMDSNRATEEFYKAHSDWFAVDIEGNVYRAGDRYISCIDSPYYEEYIPEILREVIAWERPEGFTDNSWSGLGRSSICYCRFSRQKFREATGFELPTSKDWDDPVYRAWIRWSYGRRLEVWDLNNRVTMDAGGEDCLWLGMLGGDFVSQGRQFRDIRAICRRSKMVMLDDQSRSVDIGFHENAEIGKRLHGLLGWEKIMPESMAMYQRSPTFRKSAASKAEARLWMVSGFAGTIQPWWHHVGAFQWDRRQFNTPIDLYRWYEKNEKYLVRREPIACVGVLYSQQNADFYGRDNAHELVSRPYYGIVQALVRARIPYLPIHLDDLAEQADSVSLLVLPNVGVLSESQVSSLREFAASGGAILATGETGLFDESGGRSSDFVLGDIFGVSFTGRKHGSLGTADTWEGQDHTYLRLDPPVTSEVYGPETRKGPGSSARHPVLKGFEETDILPFGGLLLEVTKRDRTSVPLTLIPPLPAYPPETSWMRTDRTKVPAMVLRDGPEGSRFAYLAADLDRRYSRDWLPDHGKLLGNLFHWLLKEDVPLEVKGKGLVDCNLYRQKDKLILHLVNLTSSGTWRSPVEEVIRLGPLDVTIRNDLLRSETKVRSLVTEEMLDFELENGQIRLEIPDLYEHEVVVIG